MVGGEWWAAYRVWRIGCGVWRVMCGKCGGSWPQSQRAGPLDARSVVGTNVGTAEKGTICWAQNTKVRTKGVVSWYQR